MPNIYQDIHGDVCAPINCAPYGKYIDRGEVIVCPHGEIYFCTTWTSAYDSHKEAAKGWKKLSPWLHPWKYAKAEKLLRPSVQTE